MGSSDEKRLTPDQLAEAITHYNVDDLTVWEGHPIDYDIGAVTVADTAFGKTSIPLIHEDVVYWGKETVQAEQVDPKDGGTLLAADLSHWPVEMVKAAALEQATRHRKSVWDDTLLAEAVLELNAWDADMAAAAGWDGDTIDELLADLDPPPPVDDVEPGPPPDDPVTKVGDVWLLGPHRLVCGDSTDPETVQTATNGKTAELIHADPPYGMGKENEGVANDNLYGPKLDAFQMEWWKACRPALVDNGSVYIWGNAPDLWRLWYVGGLGDSERLSLRNEIVWDKREGHPTMLVSGVPLASRRMYHPTERCLFFMLGDQEASSNADEYWEGWEPIRSYLDGERERLGWSTEDAKRAAGHSPSSGCHWFARSQWSLPTREVYEAFQQAAGGDGFRKDYDEIHAEWLAARAPFDNTHDNMTDVWDFPRVTGDDREGHATPKPVDMMARVLKSSTTPTGAVLAPFGGSGPELIAAEQTGRTYYGIELLPRWCDVICRRYQEATGTVPVLESTGQPHDFSTKT